MRGVAAGLLSLPPSLAPSALGVATTAMSDPPLARGQVVRLLEALPPPPARARPAPSFAGAALALPGAPPGSPLARSALFSSTLSQMSSLAASGASAVGAGADPAAGAAAVQIWPVAALAGGGAGASAGAPSLALTIGPALLGGAAAGPAGGSSAAGLDGRAPAGAGRAGAAGAGPGSGGDGGAAEDAAAGAQLRLRPATVWLSLPLLQRVEAFLAPLALAQARAALARCAPCRPPDRRTARGCRLSLRPVRARLGRRRVRARRWPTRRSASDLACGGSACGAAEHGRVLALPALLQGWLAQWAVIGQSMQSSVLLACRSRAGP